MNLHGDSRGRGRPHQASGLWLHPGGRAQGPWCGSLTAPASAPAAAPLLPDAEFLHDEEDTQV